MVESLHLVRSLHRLETRASVLFLNTMESERAGQDDHLNRPLSCVCCVSVSTVHIFCNTGCVASHNNTVNHLNAAFLIKHIPIVYVKNLLP